MIEMMKTESDKNETLDPSNFAKKISWTATKFKVEVTKLNGSYFKVVCLGARKGSRPKGVLVPKAII